MVGLITDDDDTPYREEVRDHALWYQDNNFSPQRQQDEGADRGLQETEGRTRASFTLTELIKSFMVLRVHSN